METSVLSLSTVLQHLARRPLQRLMRGHGDRLCRAHVSVCRGVPRVTSPQGLLKTAAHECVAVGLVALVMSACRRWSAECRPRGIGLPVHGVAGSNFGSRSRLKAALAKTTSRSTLAKPRSFTLAESGDRLEPAEHWFDARARGLTLPIPHMPGGATVDGAAPGRVVFWVT